MKKMTDEEIENWIDWDLVGVLCNENTMNDYYPSGPAKEQPKKSSEYISPAEADELEDGFDIFVVPGYQPAPKPARKPRAKKVSPLVAELQLPEGVKARKVRGQKSLVLSSKKAKKMKQILLTDEEYKEIDLLLYLNDPCYEEDRKRRSAEWAHHPRANVADAMARLARDEADNSHNGEG